MQKEVKAPLNRFFAVGKVTLRSVIDLLHAYRAVRKFPEPTLLLRNLPCAKRPMLPNTRRLIELRDEFFSLERNVSRNPFFRFVWNLVIYLYDLYPFYRHRIDWIVERLATLFITARWIPRPPMKPKVETWKEWDSEMPWTGKENAIPH